MDEPRWSVENRRTGETLGTFAGWDERSAMDACARSLGYADYDEMWTRTRAANDFFVVDRAA